MNQYKAEFQFIGYKASATIWARSELDAKKMFAKKFKKGTLLTINQI